jgi:hypothetical protein
MKFDKTVFAKQSFQAANDAHQSTYQLMNEEEKTAVFHYLMSVSYGFLGKPWPKIDKEYFNKRRFDD